MGPTRAGGTSVMEHVGQCGRWIEEPVSTVYDSMTNLHARSQQEKEKFFTCKIPGNMSAKCFCKGVLFSLARTNAAAALAASIRICKGKPHG